MTGSLLLGYSNEAYFRAVQQSDADPPGEFRAAVKIFVRPDDNTTVTTGYDSLNRYGTLSAFRSQGNGIGRWDTTVHAQSIGVSDATNAGASLGYYGNRGEVLVSHYADALGPITRFGSPSSTTQRSSVRVGASLAFADGVVAVGPPIRGNAFALVTPHPSIAGKQITVGTPDYVRARADGWGPAVVTDIPAYVPSNVPVDVDDLPIGYSLGAAAFDLRGSYRAGHVLEVGSDYSVSAVGTLVDSRGEPVALTSAVAHSIEQPSKQVAFFTNGAGRFGADGLAPGRWRIELSTDQRQHVTFEIPRNVQGLHKVGTLRTSDGAGR